MSGPRGGYCPICSKTYGPEFDRCPVDGFLFQSRDALRPGTVIDITYKIVERLGAGGMGETYLVQHVILGEKLVLKRIRTELAEDPLYQQCFMREAHALAALRDVPAVIQIRNACQTREGYLALVLEYAEGGNLLQWLESERGGGPLEPAEAVGIAAELAEALAAAHALGILHRDVKPQNILMRPLKGGGFQLKLCDFGLAVQRVEEMSRQGTATTRFGTPGYAAPEQYTLPSREQDARVDVFGLGMTLYRLVAGRLPWDSSEATWPLACTKQPRKSLRELRPALGRERWLENLLVRMTAVERGDRMASAAEALEAMREVLAETRPMQVTPVATPPAPRVQPPERVEPTTDEREPVSAPPSRPEERPSEPRLERGETDGARAVVRDVAAPPAAVKPASAPHTPPADPALGGTVRRPRKDRRVRILVACVVVVAALAAIIWLAIGGRRNEETAKNAPETQPPQQQAVQQIPSGQPVQPVPSPQIDQSNQHVTPPPAPSIQQFVAQPNSVQRGQASALHWQVTGETTSISIDQGIGAVQRTGSQQVQPDSSTAYRLTATGPGGTTTAIANVSINAPPAPVVQQFTAEPSTVQRGQPVTLRWQVSGDATTVSIDPGVGKAGSTGSQRVQPDSSTTYRLSATGPGGTATWTAAVTVSAPPPAPVVQQFTAVPNSFQRGQPVSLRWQVTGDVTTVLIDPGVGKAGSTGSEKVQPDSATSYRLTATGPGGTATATANVSVTAPPPTPTPATTTEHRVGETKVNPRDGLTYVWIPPGTFTMGCSLGDSECQDDEKPAHQVNISKGFWIGQTEVTQDAYQRVAGNNPSNFKGGRLPVETVTWNDAQSYCGAAGMRLPTEAEWEYAARAGDSSARYGPLDSVAWYSANSGSKTHEVAQKQANRFGLFDMLGNVWEWVADWYGPYAAGNQRDPHGPSGGQYRVLRGGSWGNDPAGARVSCRGRDDPEVRGGSIGLRCAGE